MTLCILENIFTNYIEVISFFFHRFLRWRPTDAPVSDGERGEHDHLHNACDSFIGAGIVFSRSRPRRLPKRLAEHMELSSGSNKTLTANIRVENFSF